MNTYTYRNPPCVYSHISFWRISFCMTWIMNVLQTFCTITRTKLSIRAVITPIIRFTIMPFIAIFKDSINNHDITSFYPKSNSPGLKNNLY